MKHANDFSTQNVQPPIIHPVVGWDGPCGVGGTSGNKVMHPYFHASEYQRRHAGGGIPLRRTEKSSTVSSLCKSVKRNLFN